MSILHPMLSLLRTKWWFITTFIVFRVPTPESSLMLQFHVHLLLSHPVVNPS